MEIVNKKEDELSICTFCC